MFRKIISSVLALIAAGCFTLYAQMSDEAVVEYIAKGVRISSFKEIIPRMNDIFIKLVKEDQ